MNTDALCNLFKNGDISIQQWQAGMREIAKVEIREAMILVKGGTEFVTPADWGYVGSQVKKQYEYLDKFTADIYANPLKWSTGQLNARAKLYGQVGYGALEDDIKREKEKSGFTEERRVLGPVKTEHCHDTDNRPGCVELAAKGWQPIGSLPKIGEASCWQNCRCKFEYRKPDPARPGKWIIEK
jgi:hypothetical protein